MLDAKGALFTVSSFGALFDDLLARWTRSDVSVWEISVKPPLRLSHIEAVLLGHLMGRSYGAARLVDFGKDLL